MDKLLDKQQSAEKYWIKQLKDNNEQFIHSYNLTIYEYTDKNNIIHLYPDNTCKLCNLIQNAIDDYCSAKTYEEQLKVINKLDIYRINNGEKITGTLLLKIRDTNKAIQNFIDKTMDCNICKIINELCEKYYNETDEIKKKELITEIEQLEMNGYDLLKYKEKNGYDLKNIDKINHYLVECHNLNHYNKIKVIDENIDDDISLNKSRWCHTCGARKPDIICTNLSHYDMNSIMNVNLPDIKCDIISKVYIRKPKSDKKIKLRGYSKIFISGMQTSIIKCK